MNIGEKIREITVVPRAVPIPQKETTHEFQTEREPASEPQRVAQPERTTGD